MIFASRRRRPTEDNACWPPRDRIRAVLCDLDGTLIVERPHTGDPALVRPMPGVVESIAKLRSRGLAIGIVTNQSGVTRGLITIDDVLAVNERVAELFGPPSTRWRCMHDLAERCRCRMPAPGMIRRQPEFCTYRPVNASSSAAPASTSARHGWPARPRSCSRATSGGPSPRPGTTTSRTRATRSAASPKRRVASCNSPEDRAESLHV